MQMSAIYYQSAVGIIKGLGAVPTSTNINLLVAWMMAEHGQYFGTYNPSLGHVDNSNNPMFTALSMPGDWYWNSNVKGYSTLSVGIEANVLSLQNGLYNTLVQAIKTSNANLFFSTSGQQQLTIWDNGNLNSGINTGYVDSIRSHFAGLSTPPSQYLTNAKKKTTTPKPSSGGGTVTEVIHTVEQHPVYLFLGAGMLAAAGYFGWMWYQRSNTN